MASFLAFIALIASRGQAFQAAIQPWQPPTCSGHQPTRLSARESHRKSHTTAFYSSTSDPPVTDKSFGNRMRNLVLKQQQSELHKHGSNKVGNKSSINPIKPSFVEEAVSLSSYKILVADETERLVVVRFYAKWCRACKAVEPSFYRLAHSMPDVKFVEVPVLEENANLHQGLGVPALPFVHIYSPTAGLVEELRMTKREFRNFQSVIATYRDGQCELVEIDPETGMFSAPFRKEDNEDFV
jgi:thiol-disulfide isomerase/thioredoxin